MWGTAAGTLLTSLPLTRGTSCGGHKAHGPAEANMQEQGEAVSVSSDFSQREREM